MITNPVENKYNLKSSKDDITLECIHGGISCTIAFILWHLYYSKFEPVSAYGVFMHDMGVFLSLSGILVSAFLTSLGTSFVFAIKHWRALIKIIPFFQLAIVSGSLSFFLTLVSFNGFRGDFTPPPPYPWILPFVIGWVGIIALNTFLVSRFKEYFLRQNNTLI